MAHHYPTVYTEFMLRFCGRTREDLKAALREMEMIWVRGENKGEGTEEEFVEVGRLIEKTLEEMA